MHKVEIVNQLCLSCIHVKCTLTNGGIDFFKNSLEATLINMLILMHTATSNKLDLEKTFSHLDFQFQMVELLTNASMVDHRVTYVVNPHHPQVHNLVHYSMCGVCHKSTWNKWIKAMCVNVKDIFCALNSILKMPISRSHNDEFLCAL